MDPASFPARPGPYRWNSWRWQLTQANQALEQATRNLPHWPTAGASPTSFPAAATPYYLSLIDPADPEDPILRQIAPTAAEAIVSPWLCDDPITEAQHAPLPRLVSRYPDRALVQATGRCAAYCRHCTRRGTGNVDRPDLDTTSLGHIVEWLGRNPGVRDVIVSGGDPLVLEDGPLFAILEALRAVPSVEILRLATRAPVTLPMRVTRRLAQRLARIGPLYVLTHFNHPRELTVEAERALAYLTRAGLPVLNQTVLLRGVNDTAEIIEQLCFGLARQLVRPYYLFLPDLVQGIEHLRPSLRRAQSIISQLRGRISGFAIPTLVIDLPGGLGKVPVAPCHAVSQDRGEARLVTPDGSREIVWPDGRD